MGISRVLSAQNASRRGLNWDHFPFWAEVIDRLRNALELPPDSEPFLLDQAIGPLTRIPHVVADLEDLLDRKKLQWDELRQVLALRPEFLEINVRFGQLGPRGVFTMLDDADILDHRVIGVDNIEHAMLNPPRQDPCRRIRLSKTFQQAAWEE